MIIQHVWQRTLSFFGGKPVVVEPVEAPITSDAGLLPIREFDEKIGHTVQFAAALSDRRVGPALRHSFEEMTRSRIYGILAGYEDQNDHDALRYDPVFKLVAGVPLDAPELASQPTLSRFENAIGPDSLFRLRDVLVDQFLQAFDAPPTQLVFDIDVFDDPTHGAQQLTFYHGFYDQYQYLPRVITCANNDLVISATLLFGTAPPSLGVDDDLEYLAQRLRAVWPDVRILVRADAGFAAPRFYATCERLGIEYTVGLGMNAVLKRHSAELLAEAEREFATRGQPQRRFTRFEYQARTWSRPRCTILKVETNAQGTNRRAVVTNRPGAALLPEATYDEYAARGEAENRNKELKRGLRAERLSDHRFLANYFRLYLHCAAANLLVRLRQVCALKAAIAVADANMMAPDGANMTTAADSLYSTMSEAEVPAEALVGYARRQYFNRRRDRDPLGEGQPETWRQRLIKVAAEVVESARRVVVRLSGSWPYLDHFRAVCDAVASFEARPLLDGS